MSDSMIFPVPSTISVPAPKRKQKKMTLAEFHTVCDNQTKSQMEENNKKNNEKIRQKERAKAKKAQRKEEEAKSWSSVPISSAIPNKEETWAQLEVPENFKPTPVKKLGRSAKGTNTTLILKNLPRENVTEKDLKRFFGNYCGAIIFVNVLRYEDGRCKGIAFIRFENVQSSDVGLGLNEFKYENRPVYVEYADSKK